MFHPPKNRYDAVRLVTSVVIAKDTLVLEEPTDPEPFYNGSTGLEEPLDPDPFDAENPAAPKLVNDIYGKRVVGRIDVRETSWLSRIFRGRRYLEIGVSSTGARGTSIPTCWHTSIAMAASRRGARTNILGA